MPEGSGRRLTEEEEERIVELRLERVPVRAVAQEIGCQPNTVTECMRRYHKTRAAELGSTLDEVRAELVDRQTRIAIDARQGAQQARKFNDTAAHNAYLSQERATLKEIAHLLGLEAAPMIQMVGSEGGPIQTDVGQLLLAQMQQYALDHPEENLPLPPTDGQQNGQSNGQHPDL
jgi:transposase-like protein|tara:strand:- start:612 stop:1136 length:525 start_codon:yes stop_codon:yes gene_type:complete